MLRYFIPGVALPALACAQSLTPAVFVANNGNLRGSVTSLRINPDATLSLVQDLVTAEVPSGQSSPGTNAYSISLSPDGAYLAVSHATSASVTEQISLIRVNPDATLTFETAAQTPDSPLDVEWVTDSLLIATRTRTSGTNEIILYRVDRNPIRLTEVAREAAGSFASRLAIGPQGLVFVNDSPLSGGGQLRVYRVDEAARTLTPLGSMFTSTTYALGMGLTPDGTRVYTAGGSPTPYRISALTLDPVTGVLAEVPGNPFPSSGQSPKECVASPDSNFLFVGHGTDATIRTHSIAPDGALSELSIAYDVGIQSSLGDITTLRVPGAVPQDLIIFTDKETFDGTPRGVFSALINPDGSIQLRTTRLDTGAISPNDLAVWPGPAGPVCDPDFNQDGNADQDDVRYLVGVLAGGENPTRIDPDFNRDGNADQDDVNALVHVVGGGPCP
ncbi:MAG: beta-propeller fold lactonase family protein [Phycisphaerales bacterium]|nr:beta-propeller fold lactonase family protein [Phycisphaerales bacterium]